MTNKDNVNPIDKLNKVSLILSVEDGDEVKRKIISGYVDEDTLVKIRLEEKEEEKKQKRLAIRMKSIRLDSEIYNIPIVVYKPKTKQVVHVYPNGEEKIIKQL